MKSKKLVTGLIMACIFAVVIIAGKNSVKVQAADGDVAIVTDGNGDEIGSYATLADAFVAAQNGYTICIISDIHGLTEWRNIINKERGNVDRFIFLGDYVDDTMMVNIINISL